MTPLTEEHQQMAAAMVPRARMEARIWCRRRNVEQGRHADAESVALEALCIAAPMWRADGGASWSTYAIGRIRIELYRWYRFDRVVYLPDHVEFRPAAASLDDEGTGLANTLGTELPAKLAHLDGERLRRWLVLRAPPARRATRRRHVDWWWRVDALGEMAHDVAADAGVSHQAVSLGLQRVRADIAAWPGRMEAA